MKIWIAISNYFSNPFNPAYDLAMAFLVTFIAFIAFMVWVVHKIQNGFVKFAVFFLSLIAGYIVLEYLFFNIIRQYYH